MFYYSRKIEDYSARAGHLTTAEHGMLTLLTDHYFLTESPIPGWRAPRIARTPMEELEPVLREFFTWDAEQEVWRNAEYDAQIEQYRAGAFVRRANGSLGGRPKGSGKKAREAQAQPAPDAPAAPAPTVTPAAPEAETGQKPKRNRAGSKTVLLPGTDAAGPVGFQRFWETYPDGKRSKKAEALAVWQRENMEEFADAIIGDVERRKAMHWGWVKEGGKYIPGAQVYLNGSRWTDDIDPIPSSAARNPGRQSCIEAGNLNAVDDWVGGGGNG